MGSTWLRSIDILERTRKEAAVARTGYNTGHFLGGTTGKYEESDRTSGVRAQIRTYTGFWKYRPNATISIVVYFIMSYCLCMFRHLIWPSSGGIYNFGYWKFSHSHRIPCSILYFHYLHYNNYRHFWEGRYFQNPEYTRNRMQNPKIKKRTHTTRTQLQSLIAKLTDSDL
jgi:hypothetical protein